jgi:hypothetical protein
MYYKIIYKIWRFTWKNLEKPVLAFWLKGGALDKKLLF